MTSVPFPLFLFIPAYPTPPSSCLSYYFLFLSLFPLYSSRPSYPFLFLPSLPLPLPVIPTPYSSCFFYPNLYLFFQLYIDSFLLSLFLLPRSPPVPHSCTFLPLSFPLPMLLSIACPDITCHFKFKKSSSTPRPVMRVTVRPSNYLNSLCPQYRGDEISGHV